MNTQQDLFQRRGVAYDTIDKLAEFTDNQFCSVGELADFVERLVRGFDTLEPGMTTIRSHLTGDLVIDVSFNVPYSFTQSGKDYEVRAVRSVRLSPAIHQECNGKDLSYSLTLTKRVVYGFGDISQPKRKFRDDNRRYSYGEDWRHPQRYDEAERSELCLRGLNSAQNKVLEELYNRGRS
jgi:hypothetical protein